MQEMKQIYFNNAALLSTEKENEVPTDKVQLIF
jgi:hypothetical protein